MDSRLANGDADKTLAVTRNATVVGSPRARSSNGLVCSAGRSIEVVAFEEALVDFFVEAADVLGVPKSVAAIYAICFASADALGFSEINERLEISSGSISQGLRVLKEIGALRVVQSGRAIDRSSSDVLQKGHADKLQRSGEAKRRDFYEPDLELRKIVTHYLETRLAKQLESGKSRLKALSKSVPLESTDSAKILRVRLKALHTWHDKTRALLPIAKTFLKLT